VVEYRHNVRKILSPSSSLLLLAKTITHPAARSLFVGNDAADDDDVGSDDFHKWMDYYQIWCTYCVAKDDRLPALSAIGDMAARM